MYIASIAADVRIHTWPDGHLLHIFKSNSRGFMKTLSWDKHGSWLTLVPSEGPAEVISVKGNLKHFHSIYKIKRPTCAAFRNNRKRHIALGTTTGMVFVYDVKWNTIRKRFPKAPSTVFKVEYCTKDSFLVAACESGEILLYNSIACNLSSSFKVPNSKSVSNVRCHPVTGDLILGGSQEGMVALWDIHTTRLKFYNQAHSAPVTDLTFSPLRSDLLVTIGLDSKLMFFGTNSNRCVMQKVMERPSTAIDFCPDGVGLAVALEDGTIQMYDTRQMKSPVHVFTAHGGRIRQLVFQKNALKETCELNFDKNKISLNVKFPQPMKIARSRYRCDLPGFMFCGDFLPDIPEVTNEASSEEASNSCLDNSLPKLNKTSSSSMCEKGHLDNVIQKLWHTKLEFLENKMQMYSRNPNRQENEGKTFQEDSTPAIKLTRDVAVQTSTSNFLKPELSSPSNLSPIMTVSQHTTKPKLSKADVKVIKDIFREELNGEINTLTHHLEYKINDVNEFIGHRILNLQILISQEFHGVNSKFKKMVEGIIAPACFKENFLMKEKINLRNVVKALQNQLLPKDDYYIFL